MAFGFNSNVGNLPHYQPNQNLQSMFLQPQGNVYNINSTLEVANVPVGGGVSVALCIPENVMYIKTMQNGSPMFYPYKIIPLNEETTKTADTVPPATQDQKPNMDLVSLQDQIKQCNEKIKELEEKLTPKKESGFNL